MRSTRALPQIMKSASAILGVIVLIICVVLIAGCGSYNKLIGLRQQVDRSWADVQSVYQRRADLIPNLVKTVEGAANFEKTTLAEVVKARQQVSNVKLDPSSAPTDPQALKQFQQTQDALSGALSRLLVVVERYPDLKANANFQALQTQLEGTENRIAVERRKFNETVQAYNTAIQRMLRSARADSRSTRRRRTRWDIRPFVRPEGRGGETRRIGQVAFRIIRPRVSHRDGLGNFRARNDDVIAFDRSIGPNKFPVFAGNCESFELASIAGFQSFCVSEAQTNLALFFLAAAGQRTGEFGVAIIDGRLRGEGEPASDLLFVFRMDVISFADVDDDGHGGVGQFQRQQLRLPQLRPLAFLGLASWRNSTRIVIGELHIKKREFGIPSLSPAENHRRKQFAILARSRGVRFALIPDRALHAAHPPRPPE